MRSQSVINIKPINYFFLFISFPLKYIRYDRSTFSKTHQESLKEGL